MSRRERIPGHPFNSWHVYVPDRVREFLEAEAERRADGSVGLYLDQAFAKRGGWNDGGTDD